jgi:hypothetical protein
MKRIILILTVLCLFACCLSGCDVLEGILGQITGEEHEHSGGEATCVAPAICDVCGNPYGDVSAHSYSEPTCDTASVCVICGVPGAGEALGHDYGEATCEDAATCQRCGKARGEALGHDYSEATCESAATCQRCGKARGEALGHDYSEATCEDAEVCKRCGEIGDAALGHDLCENYLYNDQYHWKQCNRCAEKKEEGEHMGGEISGNERARCSVCSAHYGEEPSISVDWTIEALTPSVGSTFSLANSRIRSWYETYDYTVTDTDQHWLGEDIFLPEVPFFTWSVGEAAQYYKLYISASEDFASYQCYLTAAPELSVEHLYTGHTYYWFVDAVYDGYTVRSEVFSFFTQHTPRTVDIDGVSNSRDIGGYITVDGMRIRQGLVYRSAKLDDITEAGRYTLLSVLGVKTDLDLRGDRNDYYKNATHPVTELNHVVVACPWYSTGGNHIWLDDYNKAEFAKAVKVFADPANYPIIFHCSLGRDRTGTLAMVLEGLLGVDENTLMMEYELSVFSYWGTNGNTKYNNGLRKNIHDTYLYINNNYEGDTFSEKVEDFLLEIGVSAEEIASIKDIMLEEVA